MRPHIKRTFTEVFFANPGDLERAAKRRADRGEIKGAEIAYHLPDSDYLIEHNLAFAGSPETVARNIRKAAEEGLINTLLCEFNFGNLPAADLERSIRMFGREVLPALRGFEPF